mmetsp:Transcript_2754/g.8677  ORF Transcript_2754/g.8677 Transcript_2754/m.8677 type:complete len:157 (-) Transcript_2754:80-550(-)|eukprot:CAMPEP_0197389816 /NCGR_PEP_ID=MMETSP1165-20131217/1966_1 /TAXON_ID=284809 /ORGANISM="Chrysocystis fragilis, Strain CCMP3189" /LENGTH=156 /DNA_ID=CAMNT_0042915257 /DNA_START=60 /DNA_END=530 /DNA_ORIENTATION=-
MGNELSRARANCGEFAAHTELACVIILGLWSIPLNHVPALARASKYGLAWALSNREQDMVYFEKSLDTWVGRADRAKANHHDNLPMLASVILGVVVLGRTDKVTAGAARIILVARIMHSLVYIAGVPGIRSVAYFTSVFALITIALRAWSLAEPTW